MASLTLICLTLCIAISTSTLVSLPSNGRYNKSNGTGINKNVGYIAGKNNGYIGYGDYDVEYDGWRGNIKPSVKTSSTKREQKEEKRIRKDELKERKLKEREQKKQINDRKKELRNQRRLIREERRKERNEKLSKIYELRRKYSNTCKEVEPVKGLKFPDLSTNNDNISINGENLTPEVKQITYKCDDPRYDDGIYKLTTISDLNLSPDAPVGRSTTSYYYDTKGNRIKELYTDEENALQKEKEDDDKEEEKDNDESDKDKDDSDDDDSDSDDDSSDSDDGRNKRASYSKSYSKSNGNGINNNIGYIAGKNNGYIGYGDYDEEYGGWRRNSKPGVKTSSTKREQKEQKRKRKEELKEKKLKEREQKKQIKDRKKELRNQRRIIREERRKERNEKLNKIYELRRKYANTCKEVEPVKGLKFPDLNTNNDNISINGEKLTPEVKQITYKCDDPRYDDGTYKLTTISGFKTPYVQMGSSITSYYYDTNGNRIKELYTDEENALDKESEEDDKEEEKDDDESGKDSEDDDESDSDDDSSDSDDGRNKRASYSKPSYGYSYFNKGYGYSPSSYGNSYSENGYPYSSRFNYNNNDYWAKVSPPGFQFV